MLRFAEPLRPAAKYLLAYSLDVAEDSWPDLYADPYDWARSFARLARCVSLDLAHQVMKNLWEGR